MTESKEEKVWIEESANHYGGTNVWPEMPRGTDANDLAAATEETKRLQQNFGFIAPAAFVYAVFYVLCMYRNGSGITFPFFVGGSLFFLCLSSARLGITFKKGSVFYGLAMVLLGISQETFGYYWMDRMKGRTGNLGIRTFNLSRYLAARSLYR